MATPASAVQTRATWKLYFELTKPRVVALIVFTAIVGTLLASPGWPPLDALIWGNLGIALASGSAAAINHVLDQKIDEQMSRTRGRPLPTGTLSNRQALIFAASLAIASMLILTLLVNPLTAVLTFASLTGRIDEVDPERGKLRVSVSIFGRFTPVELEYWQVQRMTD